MAVYVKESFRSEPDALEVIKRKEGVYEWCGKTALISMRL